jgi:hypothetical protein
MLSVFLIVVFAVLGPPLLFIFGLGALIDWLHRRRDRVVARQVTLTEALCAPCTLSLSPSLPQRGRVSASAPAYAARGGCRKPVARAGLRLTIQGHRVVCPA